MTCALALARAGVRSALFERNQETTSHPKMDITNGRSMELFRLLGLAEKLRDLRQRAREVVWLNPMLERDGVDPHSAPMQNIRDNVDRLLPAHSLFALRQLVDHLCRENSKCCVLTSRPTSSA